MKCILFLASLLVVITASADFGDETAPHQEFGNVDGFKVMTDHPSGTQLTKLGVKKGDVVMAVNGRGIASVEDAKRAYGESNVKAIVILREDKPILLKAKGK
jgi:S1-C subfamily serine protease